jgi:hypothetical protein
MALAVESTYSDHAGEEKFARRRFLPNTRTWKRPNPRNVCGTRLALL